MVRIINTFIIITLCNQIAVSIPNKLLLAIHFVYIHGCKPDKGTTA